MITRTEDKDSMEMINSHSRSYTKSPNYDSLYLELNFNGELRNLHLDKLKELFSLICFKGHDHVLLELSQNQLGNVKINSIAQLISKTGPKNLHLNLSSNGIGLEGFTTLCKAIQDGAAHGLSLDLSNCRYQNNQGASIPPLANEQNLPIDKKSVIVLTEIFPFVPPDFSIYLGDVDREALKEIVQQFHKIPSRSNMKLRLSSVNLEDMPLLIESLMSVTSITELTWSSVGFSSLFHSSSDNSNQLFGALNRLSKKIKYLCLRNRLIFEYPELENYIKKISMENHLYKPGITTVNNPSRLTILAASLFFNLPSNQNNLYEFEELRLTMDSIRKQLEENLPKMINDDTLEEKEYALNDEEKREEDEDSKKMCVMQ